MRRSVELLAIALILALPVMAGTPEDVVREHFARYTAGDLRGAAELWIGGDDFLRRHARRLERRCLRLESLRVQADPADPTRVETEETIAVRSRTTHAAEWLATSRSRFTLRHDGTQWRIVAWTSRDEEALEQLVAGGELEAGAGTTALVGLLGRRSIELVNQRRLEDAGRISDAAMRMAARLGDAGSFADAASARSVVVRTAHLGDLPSSAELAREAVSYAEAAGDPDRIARALYRLARCREELDGVPDHDSLERAISLVDDLDDPSLAPHLATHFARALEIRGRRREAFRFATMAVRYAEETDDASARINAWTMSAAAYHWTGNTEVAERFYRRAAELSEAVRFPGGAALAIGGMAVTTYDDAVRIIDEGLRTVTGADRQWLLRIRAGKSHGAGRLDEAKKALDEAVALVPPTAESRQSIELMYGDIAMGRGDFVTALRHYGQGRGANSGIDDRARLAQARALLCLGRLDEARRMLDDLVEDGEAPGGLDPQARVFEVHAQGPQRELAGVLIESGAVDAALAMTERIKAASLRIALEGSDGGEQGMAPEQQKRLGELEDRIHALQRELYAGKRSAADAAALRGELEEARLDLREFRASAFAAQPAASMFQRRGAPFRIDELPPHLDDVAFASFLSQDTATWVFVVEPKRHGRRKVTVRPIPAGRHELGRRVARFTSLVEQRNLRALQAGAELYDLLLRPVEPFLREAKTLCIIPDGRLWHLPFHVLGPRGGGPLIERIAVFYAPSLGVLAMAEPARRRPGAASVLALANPHVTTAAASLYRSVAPEAATGPIPETEHEVRAIGGIYGKAHSRIYVGSEARESVLKREASHHDVLHIATHGLNLQHAPMFSALLLTTAPEDVSEDGLLEAREIAELKLHADLAVLSACETGKAEKLEWDGLVGLSWALLSAGARATVVSQWKAQSSATAMLMIEFHRRLARGMPKPQALREAQLAVRARREYRHPFYWAPFIMIGTP